MPFNYFPLCFTPAVLTPEYASESPGRLVKAQTVGPDNLLVESSAAAAAKSLQSCLTLCDPMVMGDVQELVRQISWGGVFSTVVHHSVVSDSL